MDNEDIMNTAMSRDKLLARGYCCGSGCKMCPYDPKHTKGTTKILKSQSKKV